MKGGVRYFSARCELSIKGESYMYLYMQIIGEEVVIKGRIMMSLILKYGNVPGTVKQFKRRNCFFVREHCDS